MVHQGGIRPHKSKNCGVGGGVDGGVLGWKHALAKKGDEDRG